MPGHVPVGLQPHLWCPVSWNLLVLVLLDDRLWPIHPFPVKAHNILFWKKKINKYRMNEANNLMKYFRVNIYNWREKIPSKHFSTFQQQQKSLNQH
jgi:hypothetical protein